MISAAVTSVCIEIDPAAIGFMALGCIGLAGLLVCVISLFGDDHIRIDADPHAEPYGEQPGINPPPILDLNRRGWPTKIIVIGNPAPPAPARWRR